MSKFWGFSVLLLLVGMLLLVSPGDRLVLNELETECRFDSSQSAELDLTRTNTVSFQGSFFVDNPDAELGYRYSRTGNRLSLDVVSSDSREPLSFEGDCLGIAVYDFETAVLEPGEYIVSLQHNGDTVDRRIIEVK